MNVAFYTALFGAGWYCEVQLIVRYKVVWWRMTWRGAMRNGTMRCVVVYYSLMQCAWQVKCVASHRSASQFVLREGKCLSSEIVPSPNRKISENFELY